LSFLADLQTRAAASVRRIVFPESADDRTRIAIGELARRKIVEPIVVLDHAVPSAIDAVRALGVEVRDPADDPVTEAAARKLFERRQRKGITKEDASALLHTPLFFADALVAAGEADGCVAGAVHTTGDVLRAALWMVVTMSALTQYVGAERTAWYTSFAMTISGVAPQEGSALKATRNPPSSPYSWGRRSVV